MFINQKNYKLCEIFIYFYFLNVIFCDNNYNNNNNNNNNNTTESINDFDKIITNTSSPYMIESIYYDYENININNNNNLNNKNKYENPSNQPDIIYPDPDKIYSRLKEIKEDTLFKLEQKREELLNKIILPSDNNNLINNINNNNNNFDKDLKGHDLIDNIMYIYYGSNGNKRKSFGGNIILIGAIFGFVAQIITIALSFLKNRRPRRTNALFPITINLLIMLCLSNFLFIIGVQSSKNILKCEITAVLLHYLHLSTAVWILIYVHTIYNFIKNSKVPNLRYNYLLSYCGPGIYVMFSYAVSSRSYEIHSYCWMSVQRGMIINFMIPISILIVITTILGTICLRGILGKQRQAIGDSIESIMETASRCDLNQTFLLHHQTTDKICDDSEKGCDEDLKSKLDLYDSKFNLAALSLAELSLQSSSEVQDFCDFKRAIRFSLFFQPTFCVCWFLGILALENSQTSCVMPAIFIICYNIMNWCLLARLSIIYPMITTIKNETPTQSLIDSPICTNFLIEETNNQTACTDTIPLLCSSSSGHNTNNNNHINNNTNQQEQNFNNQLIRVASTWETNLENSNNNYDCISTISS